MQKTPDCWIWTARRLPHGYGIFGFGPRHYPTLAHRIAWQWANGPIPADMCVLHRCDNPPCVNPAHLFLGTSADNHTDMVRKGRSTAGRRMPPTSIRRGEANPAAKITVAAISSIRQRYAVGHESMDTIARDFGVTGSTIQAIVKRRTWRHVL